MKIIGKSYQICLKYRLTFRKGLFIPLNPAYTFSSAHRIKHSALAKERVTGV